MNKKKEQKPQTPKPSDGWLRWPEQESGNISLVETAASSFSGTFDLLHQSLGLVRRRDRPESFALQPPVGARSVSAPLSEYLEWVFPLRYSTLESRLVAGCNPADPPGRGNRPQGETLLRRMVILLKYAQCGLSNRGKKLNSLMERYVEGSPSLYAARDDDFSFDIDDVKKLRKRFGEGHILRSPDRVRRLSAILTSLLLRKEDTESLGPDVFSNLRQRHWVLQRPMQGYVTADQTIGYLGHFWDLSQHSDIDLTRLISAIAPDIDRTLPDRLAEVDHIFNNEYGQLADQMGPLMRAIMGEKI